MLGLSAGLHYPKFPSGKIVLPINRFGWIQGVTHGTFLTAYTMGDPGNVEDNPSGNKSTQYFYSASRGGTTHRFQRTFFYFQTAGINSTPTNGVFRFHSNSFISGTGVILLVSEAFGGDGLTALSAADFHLQTDYSKPYSLEYDATSGAGTGWNEIPLNGDALNAINTLNDFIFVMVTHTHDYGNTAAVGPSNVSAGMAVTMGNTLFPIELILNQ